MKPGGILAFSTSRSTTDVSKLFFEIMGYLTENGLWNAGVKEAFRDAFQRNREMEPLIRRDTEEDIRRYVTNAGFHVERWVPDQYVNCVVVVQAMKPVQAGP